MSHKTVYRNRFQHEAEQLEPRKVRKNISAVPSTLPASATIMAMIAAPRSVRAETTLPAKLAKLLRAMSAPCGPVRGISCEDRRARSSTMGNSICSGGIV